MATHNLSLRIRYVKEKAVWLTFQIFMPSKEASIFRTTSKSTDKGEWKWTDVYVYRLVSRITQVIDKKMKV